MKITPNHPTEPSATDLPVAGCLVRGLPIASPQQTALLDDLTAWAASLDGIDTAPFTASEIAHMVLHTRHIERLARLHADMVIPILSGNGAALFAAAQSEFIDGFATTDADMMRSIRILRQKSALIVALGDIARLTPVDQQMRWLSTAAETALQGTVRYLFWEAGKRDLVPPLRQDLVGCGWTILALGKLGASELNYSSDVDLIILHDPATTPLRNPDNAQQFYVEMTRKLVRLLADNTRDGIGWRVDLRLRPDPGATAVSIQREAALIYYESIARTWERVAFIRARPVGGDLDLGYDFLQEIQPFIWRKTLDYTVFDDMKSMLRRPGQAGGWAGYNLKNGDNAIRKIEFFTHILQLVAGGRQTENRHIETVPALTALAEFEWIDMVQRDQLIDLYHWLRQAEHRLQMLADAQTHSLPRGAEELDHFARFLGWQDAEPFLDQLAANLGAIAAHTTHRLFDGDSDTAPHQQDGHDRPMLDDEYQLEQWLETHGFDRPTDIVATISSWLAGRIAATRGERARHLLNTLLPDMLVTLAKAESPDETFNALVQFIENLPASVQIFSLLDHNRQLTQLLCDMLVLSPRMANYLRYNPALFDLVLFSEFFTPLPDSGVLEAELRAATEGMSVEETLATIQRQAWEWRFRAEVLVLSRLCDHRLLGASLSAIADAVVAVTLDLARSDMERRHGNIEGEIAILGLGRVGVGRLTAQSDLDLVAIYDAPDTAVSDGTRTLGAHAYFTRLIQTFISWMSVTGRTGVFYEIDMRLRPDGDKSSVAVPLARFRDYYAGEAWIWEYMALAKARILTPHTGKLAATLAAIPVAAITSLTDGGAINIAAHDMRTRLRKSYGNAHACELRRQPGGLAELDLLIQSLRLHHAALFTSTGQSQADTIDRLRDADLLDAETASSLLHASNLFHQMHHYLRLCFGTAAAAGRDLPESVAQFILASLDYPDWAQLEAELQANRDQVTLLFDQLLPLPPTKEIAP